MWWDHPILGESPEVPGFFFANGFSGHGVMHSPATGKILSDLILTGMTDLIDAPLLNLSRFAEGRTIHETALGEVELWSKTAAAQLDAQLRERRRNFGRRIEAVDRIQQATGGLNDRIGESNRRKPP